MIQQFGDYAISFTERTSDDEYHAAKTHQSNTVAMWVLPLAGLFGAAALAWALPGLYSLLGAAVMLIVLAVTQQSALLWMKNYAPRPKAVSPPKYLVPALLLGLVMIAGVIWNAALSIDRSWPIVVGMIIGAIVGAVLAGIATPRGMAADYDDDTARLEAELED